MKRSIIKKASVAFAAIAIIGGALMFRIETAMSPNKPMNEREIKTVAIDRYFSDRHMPLAGYGKTMVAAAEKNGIDWRLIPAIAVRESSGGLHACGSNVLGWASCKRTFKTIDEAIETVARHIGGNATSTAAFYRGKTTDEILRAYNPPSISPNYAAEVEAIMAKIAPSP